MPTIAIFSDLVGCVQSLFQTTPSESLSSNLRTNTRDQLPPNRQTRAVPVTGVPASSSPQSGKRRRSEDRDSPQRPRRSSRAAGHAAPLVQDFHIAPPDATAITSPIYNPQADWRPIHKTEQNKMGGPYRPARGQVQPRNTLGQQTAQSRRTVQPTGQKDQTARPFTQFAGDEHEQSSTGSFNLTDPIDDAEDERPPSKKPRHESSAIDLLHSQDFAEGEAVSARQLKSRSASHGSGAGLSDKFKRRRKNKGSGGDSFGNHELYRADQNLHYGFPGNGTTAVRHDSGSHSSHDMPNGTAQEPVELDSDEVIWAVKPSSSDRGRKRDEVQEVPVINLEMGVEEAAAAQKRKRKTSAQGDASDMAKVNDFFASKVYSKRPSGPTHAGSSALARRSIPQPSRPPAHLDQNDSARATGRALEPGSGILRQHFMRDDTHVSNDTSLKTMSVSQHAQPQNVAPVSRISAREDSPDELNGAPTIRSQGTRNVSPVKQQSNVKKQRDIVIAAYSDAQVSTSKLRATEFTRSEPKGRPRAEQKLAASVNMGDKRANVSKIAFKGYVSEDPSLQLQWDQLQQEYILLKGSEPVICPIDKKMIKIGQVPALHYWQGCVSSTHVVLQTSADNVHSGYIALEFADLPSMSHCYQALHKVQPSLIDKAISTEKLSLIFANIYRQEQRNHQQALLKAHERASLEQAHNRRELSRVREIEDEQILYEDASPPPIQQKLKSAMRGSTLSETLAEEQEEAAQHARQRTIKTVSPHFDSRATLRSTRQSKPTQQYRDAPPELVKWTQHHQLPTWAKSVLYPTTGPRRVTVDQSDLEHLDAGEFLNDNIVNYALRHIEENMAPAHKDRVHFFNTFFFTSLTSKNGKKEFNYDAVKKWTKSVDLLSKPHVVVPINLDLHWFVAIIYNLPALQRKMLDSDDIDPPTDANSTDAEGFSKKLAEAAPPDNGNKDEKYDSIQETTAPQGEHPAVEVALGQKAGPNIKGKRKRNTPVRKFTADQPMIISLDSFGATRTNELRLIKKYVIEEARDKRGMAVSLEDLQGVNAKGIPQQQNFYDCGVYLIGYMKEFARDPDRFVKKILGREIDTSDFREFNTASLRDEIRENLIKHGDEQDAKYREEKRARSLAKKNAQTPQTGNTHSATAISTHHSTASTIMPAVPTSSQPARDSPSAERLNRRNLTEYALQSPRASGRDLRSSAEPPTSATFPANPYSTQAEAVDADDDLEVDAPQPLAQSRVVTTPEYRPSDEQSHSDDEEMLDKADPVVHELTTCRSASTSRGQSPNVHNAPLILHSSLERDTAQQDLQTTALSKMIDSDAKREDQPDVKHEEDPGIKQGDDSDVKETDEVMADAESKESAGDMQGMLKSEHQIRDDDIDVDVTSESAESEEDTKAATVISIGDEDDANPLDGPAEIADSQLEVQHV